MPRGQVTAWIADLTTRFHHNLEAAWEAEDWARVDETGAGHH